MPESVPSFGLGLELGLGLGLGFWGCDEVRGGGKDWRVAVADSGVSTGADGSDLSRVLEPFGVVLDGAISRDLRTVIERNGAKWRLVTESERIRRIEKPRRLGFWLSGFYVGF